MPKLGFELVKYIRNDSDDLFAQQRGVQSRRVTGRRRNLSDDLFFAHQGFLMVDPGRRIVLLRHCSGYALCMSLCLCLSASLSFSQLRFGMQIAIFCGFLLFINKFFLFAVAAS